MEDAQYNWVHKEALCLEASLTVGDTHVSASIELRDQLGGRGIAVHVYSKGERYFVPLDVDKRKIHTCSAIDGLFIRAFSRTTFVVFVAMADGAWPFGCFTAKPEGGFHHSVFYSSDSVADIAAISDRYIVVTEVVMCHRRLFVQCYDMLDATQRVWFAGTRGAHREYYMMASHLTSDTDAGTVTVYLECAGSCVLALTVSEHGVVQAEGDVEWHWKLGTDETSRSDVVCTVKPVVYLRK